MLVHHESNHAPSQQATRLATMQRVVPAAVLLAVSLLPLSAWSQVTTYTYTGQDLTSVQPGFSTSDKVQFSVTLDAPLGANLVDQSTGGAANTLGWSLSVGDLSFNSLTAGSVLYSINFSTNAVGTITGWQFTTQTDTVAPGLLPPEYPPTPYEEEIISANLPAGTAGFSGVNDLIYIPSIAQDSYYAYNSGSPGTWTVTAVPEPASQWLWMAGLGLVGAASAGRRFRSGASGRLLC